MSDRPRVPTANAGAAAASGGRLLDHLASAADMVGRRRFREAEVEVLRALSIVPSDLRALKLLALVRFKLGRLDEARAVCREIAATLPRDVGIRLKLGLIALKLDRVDESVHELELAAQLAPDERRAWSYLGFAYARRGERGRAAAAFRRAGQEDHAAEAEQGVLAGRGALAAAVSGEDEPGVETRLAVHDPVTHPDRDSAAPSMRSRARVSPVASLVDHVASWLAPAADEAVRAGATVRLPISDGAPVYVRQDGAVACGGAVHHQSAYRHVRGRTAPVRLAAVVEGGAAVPFLVLHGSGEVFVAAPAGRLVSLELEDDTLYVREDRVLAFEGTLAWESGVLPRSGLRMLQFRGRGLVALALAGEPGAMRVAPEHAVFVSPSALLGWAGRVVGLGGGGVPGDAVAGETAPAGVLLGITCEGEGVVLMDVAPGSDKEGP